MVDLSEVAEAAVGVMGASPAEVGTAVVAEQVAIGDPDNRSL